MIQSDLWVDRLRSSMPTVVPHWANPVPPRRDTPQR